MRRTIRTNETKIGMEKFVCEILDYVQEGSFSEEVWRKNFHQGARSPYHRTIFIPLCEYLGGIMKWKL